MSASTPTTLIVGAGIFGASTAAHLSRSVPGSSITLVDRHPLAAPSTTSRPSTALGASHDVSKITRADYTSRFYAALGREALALWAAPPLRAHWHASGWVALHETGSDWAQSCRANLRATGPDATRDVSNAELREGWQGVFAGADTEGFEGAYWNGDVGWSEAEGALRAVLDEAQGRGVRYLKGEVKGLVARDGKRVGGVVLESGEVVEADRVVLATGAWTATVMAGLEEELGLGPELRIGTQIKAAGVSVVQFELPPEDAGRFKDMPVLVHGGGGDCLPPHDGRLLKLNNATSFTNTVTTPGGSVITAPAEGSQFDMPAALRRETLAVAQRVIGKDVAREDRVAYYRMCWDSITPQQHQLITKHPVLSNLFLAVGGSFHSWKFLPNIGKYVANVVMGESNGEECDTIWGWKDDGWNTEGGGVHTYTVPRREYKDFAEA